MTRYGVPQSRKNFDCLPEQLLEEVRNLAI